jgi:hypothetical protein
METPPIYRHLIEMPKDMPWDRQRKEPDRAFRHFCLYKSLEGNRTTAALAKSLGRKSHKLFDRWAGLYDWEARAQAFDDHLDRQWQKTEEGRRATRNERHSRIAEIMQKFSAEQLAAHIRLWEQAKRKAAETGELPEPTVKPEVAARVGKTGVELDRLVHGESVEGVVDTSVALKQYSVEELAAFRESRIKAVK